MAKNKIYRLHVVKIFHPEFSNALSAANHFYSNAVIFKKYFRIALNLSSTMQIFFPNIVIAQHDLRWLYPGTRKIDIVREFAQTYFLMEQVQK